MFYIPQDPYMDRMGIEASRIFCQTLSNKPRLGESYVPRCVTHSSAECWAGARDSEWPFGFASNAPSSWLPTHALETSVMEGWLRYLLGALLRLKATILRFFIVLDKAQDSPDKPRFAIAPKNGSFCCAVKPCKLAELVFNWLCCIVICWGSIFC